MNQKTNWTTFILAILFLLAAQTAWASVSSDISIFKGTSKVLALKENGDYFQVGFDVTTDLPLEYGVEEGPGIYAPYVRINVTGASLKQLESISLSSEMQYNGNIIGVDNGYRVLDSEWRFIEHFTCDIYTDEMQAQHYDDRTGQESGSVPRSFSVTLQPQKSKSSGKVTYSFDYDFSLLAKEGHVITEIYCRDPLVAGEITVTIVAGSTTLGSEEQKLRDAMENNDILDITVYAVRDDDNANILDDEPYVDAFVVFESVSSVKTRKIQNTSKGLAVMGDTHHTLMCNDSNWYKEQVIDVTNNSHYITNDYSTGDMTVLSSSNDWIVHLTDCNSGVSLATRDNVATEHCIMYFENHSLRQDSSYSPNRRTHHCLKTGDGQYDRQINNINLSMIKTMIWAGNYTGEEDTPPTIANESAARGAMDAGISSSQASGGTTYDDQQIYARNLSNGQILGTFDKVLNLNSQYWAFNYVNSTDTPTEMFNITPTLYVLELSNLTTSEIESLVTATIDSTKTS